MHPRSGSMVMRLLGSRFPFGETEFDMKFPTLAWTLPIHSYLSFGIQLLSNKWYQYIIKINPKRTRFFIFFFVSCFCRLKVLVQVRSTSTCTSTCTIFFLWCLSTAWLCMMGKAQAAWRSPALLLWNNCEATARLGLSEGPAMPRVYWVVFAVPAF